MDVVLRILYLGHKGLSGSPDTGYKINLSLFDPRFKINYEKKNIFASKNKYWFVVTLHMWATKVMRYNLIRYHFRHNGASGEHNSSYYNVSVIVRISIFFYTARACEMHYSTDQHIVLYN